MLSLCLKTFSCPSGGTITVWQQILNILICPGPRETLSLSSSSSSEWLNHQLIWGSVWKELCGTYFKASFFPKTIREFHLKASYCWERQKQDALWFNASLRSLIGGNDVLATILAASPAKEEFTKEVIISTAWSFSNNSFLFNVHTYMGKSEALQLWNAFHVKNRFLNYTKGCSFIRVDIWKIF